MAIRPLPWAALVLAPLVSIPALTILGLGSSDAGILSDLGVGLVFGITVALPFSYAGMILVGLPWFLLLRRFGLAAYFLLPRPSLPPGN